MHTQPAAKRTAALTLVEVLVVVAVVVLLAVLFYPRHHAAPKRMHSQVECVNNLKMIGISFRLWEGDNGGKYPMQFYATDDGMIQRVTHGNAWLMWQVMSNELSTPKILHCPSDDQQTQAASFDHKFGDANISYFFSLDATETYPQMILDGDDNLAVNGFRVSPGILNLETNASVAWTPDRHRGGGNFGLADGSVWQATSTSLRAALVHSGTATNRLVIP